ncbi:hypothetical protein BDK51DRAFT_21278 [Blyttiomyces helicus]|uniref:MYND-type domain-containing protein n=1 Tax=Blyttiomyces helicus TaxID=388810 RepID=A0A4P9WF36_9FUNG|nr:hypothetical protein BDK51DRAFT_21278 [Blyttiomyces helicus]|eukprot:RKO91234.1 hypothetical protein BDK51DRAFT_21278 [Blyttiomyces helicus]
MANRPPEICSQCSATPAPSISLKSCAKCRTVRYCSRECQVSHWGAHKASCAPRGATIAPPLKRKTFHDFAHSQSAGTRSLVFDHVFGGNDSLVQVDRFRKHGLGVVLCELSCSVVEFRAPRDRNRLAHRRIRSTFIPASGFAALDRRWDQDEPLHARVATLVKIAEKMECQNPGQLFVMIVESPFDMGQKYQAFLILNWLKFE